MSYEHKAALEVAHNLQKQKNEKLVELVTQHLGYAPTVAEALSNLKQDMRPDGSHTWYWDGQPIVTFHAVEVPSTLARESKFEASIGFKSHV
ncbi:hypothetical protein VpaJT1_9 [Vibrio phage VpaJT_1]|nr:hypothetical protein VpaJT1_9 [Vibrio phage VpaJT_1]